MIKDFLVKNEEQRFTYRDFETLYASVLEVQQKGSREIGNELIRSFPIDMELQLSKLVQWMRKKIVPYEQARLEYGKSLGFLYDANKMAFTLPPSTIELSPAQKEQFNKDRQEKIKLMNDASEELYNSEFEEAKQLFELLPLSMFTKKRMEESKIVFKDISNIQPFLEYCVAEDKLQR